MYTTTEGLGRHNVFVAQAATTSVASTPKDLVQQVQNWRDLVKHVGQDPTVTTYNVVFADPSSMNANLTTRFRLFENQANAVHMAFGVEVGNQTTRSLKTLTVCTGVWHAG